MYVVFMIVMSALLVMPCHDVSGHGMDRPTLLDLRHPTYNTQ